jgi:beta-lactam-binding protein with PASTA domain/tRNA A-37 threonylcarbamoyl transferase component Bud32
VATLRIADSVGRVLGDRYRLTRPLGTGASAYVYVADDVTLRRRVAVKVLHPGLADDEGFLRRFRAEARAVAALHHPHILRVYDWGEDDGSPYLVTDLLEGGSLRALLDRGHLLSPAQATAVGLGAAQALAHAHRRGLVHRDIKPANLLFDDEGRVCVADFGLARALAESTVTEPSGAVVGTARYAAPEQVRGRMLDARADVYSLALVLVEATTGSVPFASDTILATLMGRLEEPLRMPGGNGPLAAVIEAAGAIDPDDRVDAAGLASALEALGRRLPPASPLPLPDLPSMDEIERDVDPTQLRGASRPRRSREDPAPATLLLDRAGLGPAAPAGGLAVPPAGGLAAPPAGGDTPSRRAAWMPPPPPPMPLGPLYGTDDGGDRDQPGEDPSATAGREVGADVIARERPVRADPASGATDTDTDTDAASGGSADTDTDEEGDEDAAEYDDDEQYDEIEGDEERYDEEDYDEEDYDEAQYDEDEYDDDDQGDEDDDGRAPRPWRPVVLAVVLVLLVVAAGVSGWVLTHQPAALATVPSLRGETEAQASAQLQQRHLVLTVVSRSYDATAPAGTVTGQTPSGGRVRQHQDVAVTLSLGPQPVKVPTRLAGVSQAEATKLIDAVGLELGKVTSKASLTIARGDVVSSSPPSGTLLPGQVVDIVISSGKPHVTVPALPAAATKSFAVAAAVLRAAHLAPSEQLDYSNTVAAGSVILIRPAAKADLVYGSMITVEVSKGPHLVTVPTVAGDTVAGADQTLGDYGLDVTGVTGNPSGTVSGTNPGPGRTVLYGSAVQILTG